MNSALDPEMTHNENDTRKPPDSPT